MNRPDPIVSVVIVSYNVKDFVMAAIDSVHRFAFVPAEIIVVDNASHDGTADELKRKYPEVIVIANDLNKGFSGANNQGFEVAKGKYILMLNPDAELLDNNLQKAIQFVEEASAETLVGPKIENPDGSLQPSAWKFQNAFAHFLEAFFLNKLVYPFNYPLETYTRATAVDSISGACILMKTETIKRLAGLDNYLFWMDDVDLCYRVKVSGGQSYYFPGWQVKHFIGESSKKNQRLVIANQIISKLKFYRKHRQWLNFVFSVLFLQIHILLRITLLAPLSIINTGFFKKWKAYLYAQRRFFQYLFLNKQSVS